MQHSRKHFCCRRINRKNCSVATHNTPRLYLHLSAPLIMLKMWLGAQGFKEIKSLLRALMPKVFKMSSGTGVWVPSVPWWTVALVLITSIWRVITDEATDGGKHRYNSSVCDVIKNLANFQWGTISYWWLGYETSFDRDAWSYFKK